MLTVSYFRRLNVSLDMLMAILNQGLNATEDQGSEARAVRCFRFNLKSISLASRLKSVNLFFTK
jgi:hypothetical protein